MKKQNGIIYHGAFNDKATYDAKTKTAVSVRDGVLEYMGAELGLEPENKLFTVYRSPATTANAAMKMAGIPITDEHVTLDKPAPTDDGTVASSEMVDALDEATKTTIAIKNKLDTSDSLNETINSGKKELSLGYNADLVPHNVYDFEQLDIMPHHLAVVDQGRCGAMCSFLDKKNKSEDNMSKKKLNALFLDADGELNMQQIVELVAGLPDAIKVIPVAKLQELMPSLMEIINVAKSVLPEDKPAVEPSGEPSGEMEDEGVTDPKEDEKTFSDAVANAVKVAVKDAVMIHGDVISKAVKFVDEGYSFAGKTTNQIMRDAIATQSSERFTDAELPLAFKMLKELPVNYKDFADAGESLEDIGDKEY